MSLISDEVQRLQILEKLTSQLREQMEKINIGKFFEESDEEFSKLQVVNMKLKHRLAVIENAVIAEKKHCSDRISPEQGILSLHEHLTNLFTDAIARAFPSLSGDAAMALISVSSKQGDYQCNSAMSIANAFKDSGIKKNPREVGATIVAKLEPSPVVAKVDVAGPGFINIFLDKKYVAESICSVLKDGVKPPKCAKKRVLVDFSSPNIAKQMHVGHLRSTIIGESISRLLEFIGHDVIRHNHLGDWGTQFGMLIAHLEDSFPKFHTESPPINDLQAFYKESKKRFDEDEEFKKRAYNCVVKLQSGDPLSVKAWTLICDVSRKEFQNIYDRLEITLEERGESFYQSRMIDVVEFLDKKGFLEDDDGRKIMWSDESKTGIPLTVVKTDGGFTYDTSDMAAIRYRFEELKADWVIYVVDAGQNTHLRNIFSCAERANIIDLEKHRVDHVMFGVVLGEDGKKFKTRSGDTVKLSDLLDEGLRRAMDKLKEKERDKVLTPEELKAAQESVAYGCIKYADLCHNRTNAYVFSFDKMLEDRGNTAVYLLYAFTRICSISRNCGVDFSNIQNILETESISLEHEKEWKLAKVLLKFSDVILKITKDLLLHSLCEYCYEVCTTFSEFYDKCYCIEKSKDGSIIKVHKSRILLCEATATVLGKCFYILGLKPVQKI